MSHSELVVPDVAAWRAWLDSHEGTSDGTWLLLAKKGTVEPTSLRYAEALEEALCSGWIDGQKRAVDAVVFAQRFTPRRRGSTWSKRNVGIVGELVAAGRMRPRGQVEIDRAMADGRWERAYAGSATVEVPGDLVDALAAVPGAADRFAALSAGERYPLLLPILTAAPALREQRITRLVRRLVS